MIFLIIHTPPTSKARHTLLIEHYILSHCNPDRTEFAGRCPERGGVKNTKNKFLLQLSPIKKWGGTL